MSAAADNQHARAAARERIHDRPLSDSALSLAAAGKLLYVGSGDSPSSGTSLAWLYAMARDLHVNPRTVRRWATGRLPIPPGVEAELRARLTARLAEIERCARAYCDG